MEWIVPFQSFMMHKKYLSASDGVFGVRARVCVCANELWMPVIIFSQTANNGQPKIKEKLTLSWKILSFIQRHHSRCCCRRRSHYFFIRCCAMLCGFCSPIVIAVSRRRHDELIIYDFVHNERCERDIFHVINCIACATVKTKPHIEPSESGEICDFSIISHYDYYYCYCFEWRRRKRSEWHQWAEWLRS